jgi:hypothetical protein
VTHAKVLINEMLYICIIHFIQHVHVQDVTFFYPDDQMIPVMPAGESFY